MPRQEPATPFGRAALKLDQEFRALSEVSDQLARVNLETDAGLDDSIKLLNKAAHYGQGVAGAMEEFARALQEAREKAEAATKAVAERAQLIQKRREDEDRQEKKLDALKEDVKAVGSSLIAFNTPGADKKTIAQELEKVQKPLIAFIEKAQAIKADCSQRNFKRLERQAEGMIDSLQASLRKISQAIARP
jgi:hypothetical protein